MRRFVWLIVLCATGCGGDADRDIGTDAPATSPALTGSDASPSAVGATPATASAETVAVEVTGGLVDTAAVSFRAAAGHRVAIMDPDGRRAWTRAIAFRPPDGRVWATASDDGRVRIWSRESAEPVRTMQAPGGTLWDVSFLGDGRHLVASAGDGSARLWDATTGDSVAAFGSETVMGLAPVRGGPLVLWTAPMRGLFAWNTETMSDEGLVGIGSWLHGLAVSPDGEAVAIVSREGYARMWNLDPRAERWTYRHPDISNAVSFSADGSRVYAGGRGGRTLSVLDRQSGSAIRTLDAGSGIQALAVDPAGRLVATAGAQVIRLWDAQTYDLRATIEAGVSRQIEDLAFSADGSTLGSADADGVVIRDVGTLLETFPPKPLDPPAPLGRVVACTTDRAGLRVAGTVLDSLTGEPVDSARVIIDRCEVRSDPAGDFDLGGVPAADSLQVRVVRAGYRTWSGWLPAVDTARLDLVLAPRLRCEGARATGLPRVETADSAVVLRLTPPMQAALDSVMPGFRPQPLSDFSYQQERGYDYACYQAPSAVIGDFNGDGSPDLLAHGRSEGAGAGVVLVSSPDGYEVVLREGLIPTTQFLTRMEPGSLRGPLPDEDPLTLQNQGVLRTGEAYVYRVIYLVDGTVRIWDYPFL